VTAPAELVNVTLVAVPAPSNCVAFKTKKAGVSTKKTLAVADRSRQVDNDLIGCQSID
jgi:hypothetical protein